MPYPTFRTSAEALPEAVDRRSRGDLADPEAAEGTDEAEETVEVASIEPTDASAR